jgi:hypothetical protein
MVRRTALHKGAIGFCTCASGGRESERAAGGCDGLKTFLTVT